MLTTERIDSAAQQQEAFRVRMEVFVKEQGVPAEIEIDEHEKEASHVLIRYNDYAIGTGRIRAVDGIAKLERVCVLPAYRMVKAGAAIMRELERIASEKGLKQAKLHAQTHAAAFYEKQGYSIVSDVFLEENIPHVKMVKQLR
ncbi:GNAT family N-acetyltransferase [Paenibacillus sp. HB172176]|uniref:GNAT family N-acetyltransferase n=1 Tax=Paenibacillus sp. HB172176 TaxID=2493690 RepID=UPI0023F97DD5|nr:GNAT family N-acetyltransferase [Paenibacillus sp. HB172176]